jgi:hypothetical protein
LLAARARLVSTLAVRGGAGGWRSAITLRHRPGSPSRVAAAGQLLAVAASLTPTVDGLGPFGPSLDASGPSPRRDVHQPPAPRTTGDRTRSPAVDMNNVNLTGRLTDEPTLRYTNDGKAVANLRLAVNGRNDHVDFLDITVWASPPRPSASTRARATRSLSAAASPPASGPTPTTSATSAPRSQPTRSSSSPRPAARPRRSRPEQPGGPRPPAAAALRTARPERPSRASKRTQPTYRPAVRTQSRSRRHVLAASPHPPTLPRNR